MIIVSIFSLWMVTKALFKYLMKVKTAVELFDFTLSISRRIAWMCPIVVRPDLKTYLNAFFMVIPNLAMTCCAIYVSIIWPRLRWWIIDVCLLLVVMDVQWSDRCCYNTSCHRHPFIGQPIHWHTCTTRAHTIRGVEPIFGHPNRRKAVPIFGGAFER